MMEWYQILSYFLTNGIRGFAGLYLVCALLLGRKDVPRMGALSAGTAAVITALLVCPVSDAGVIGVEILLLAVGARMFVLRDQIRMSLFILFFYEIAAALWEFIISCVFAIAFRVGYLARQCVSHQAMDAFWPCLTGQESAGPRGRIFAAGGSALAAFPGHRGAGASAGRLDGPPVHAGVPGASSGRKPNL